MRAIALISGGLDSILAAKVIQNSKVEVIPLHFSIPFSHNAIKSPLEIKNMVLKNLKIELKQRNLAEEFLGIIKSPEHGFGSKINPCIDCKILMLKKTKELMNEWEAKFVITGEVLGQRPLSQNRNSLTIIENKSGLGGFLLRPLSAKLLAPTIPEQEKWVEREKLLDISGRSRKPQMELAEKLGIKDYAQPTGGCLLTDPEFAKKLKDLLENSELSLENIELLKNGRYFRISNSAKLIVGRNEKENRRLEELAREDDYLFMPKETTGPTALGRGEFSEELIKFSSKIVSRYCDKNRETEPAVIYKRV
jgi:tRNA U34 2-thiouridine synthase MnmA/TrmU